MGDRKKPDGRESSAVKRKPIRRTRPLCTKELLDEDKFGPTPPASPTSTSATQTTTVSIEMGRKSTRDKDKKKRGPIKERWLLTRKTWKYMADAGRRLIPEGAQNRFEDIPKIEQYFQHVCRSEPRFVLWRRKWSYPGARTTSRNSKWRGRGTIPKGIRLGPDPPDEHTQNADLIIGMLKNYLNLNEEKKTTMLLGAQTVRPDQTDSPSAHRPSQLISSSSSQLMTTTVRSPPGVHASTETARTAEINAQIDELLERLRSYSRSCSRSILSPDMINIDILENKALLKKIYTELKKQQLHRILGRHSSVPPNLPHSSSFSSLWNFRRDGSVGEGNLNKIPSGGNIFSEQCAAMANKKPPPQPPPPPEKKLATLGTQTDFIPLHVLQRMAKEYEVQKKEEEKFNRQTDEESDKGAHQPQQHSRRKSSIDNEDVSQSVSDTIKRYLRMARKKSVADDHANRFKRVNYDRNLRNIRAKGEINPPGMDEGPCKATQTLDAWPVIAIGYIRGNDNSKILEDAHADWLSSLQKRIRQKEEYEEHVRQQEQQRQQQQQEHHQSNEQKDQSTSPTSPQQQQTGGIFHSGTQFLSNLWHGHHHGGQDSQQQQQQQFSPSTTGTMQKSKSSSNVGQFVSKKIWRSRSKSQTRTSSPSKPEWTPQGNCVWTSASGKRLILTDSHLQDLTDVERKVLHRVAIEKINQLNIGVSVTAPGEASSTPAKSQKRRPLLIKRKALTTGFFDSGKKSDTKGGEGGGLVFGVTLEKCVDNDNRLSKDAPSSSERSSRNSIASLLGGTPKIGSCESLPLRSNYLGPDDGNNAILGSRSQSDVRRTSQDDEDLGTCPGGKMSRSNAQQVPALVIACIKHLEEHGLHTVGIFRVSTSKKRVRQLKEDFDRGEITALDPDICPHDVATILKEYLRDLPEPLICRNLYKAFVKTQKIRNRRLQLEALSHLVQLLPVAHRDTLYVLLTFLAKIVRASDDITSRDGTILSIGNKMDSNNLATVFAPNILRSTIPGQGTTEHEIDDQIDVINVIRTMIDHYEDLFRIPADLLDEVYTNMIDTFPQQLDYLCERRDMHENSDDWDSAASNIPISSPPPGAVPIHQDHKNSSEQGGGEDMHPKRMIYSRQDFTHENAAKGDPNGNGFANRRRDRVSKMKYVESEQEMVRRRRRERSIGENNSKTLSLLSNNSGANASAISKQLYQQQQQQHNVSANGASSGNSGSCGDEIHSKGGKGAQLSSSRRSSSSDNCPRRLSTPFVLHETGVVTASLKIPVHMQGTTTNIFQTSTSSTSGTFGMSGVQTDGKDNCCNTATSTNRGSIQLDLSDIPFIEDSEGQFRQSPITGTLSFGGRKDSIGSTTYQIPISYEGRMLNTPTNSAATTPDSTSSRSTFNIPPLSSTSTSTSTSIPTKRADTARQAQRKHSSPIIGLTSNSDQFTLGDYTPSGQGIGGGGIAHTEPKIATSITNIGGAVLKSKTADFERMLTQSKKHKSGDVAGDDTTRISAPDNNFPVAGSGRQSGTGQASSLGANGEGGTGGGDRSKRSSQGPIYKRQELISSAKRSSK